MGYIEEIKISNFRNIKSANISFNKNLNIFFGDNAQGKTNLLECIYLSSIGRSSRTRQDKDFVNFDSEDCQVRLKINNNAYIDTINMHLKKNAGKGYAVNMSVIRTLAELFGIQPIIFFSPDDLRLINLGPNERRRFIDIELCQSNKIYYDSLLNYHNILKQRNLNLKKISRSSKWKDSLFAWDEQIIYYGKKLIADRESFIEKLNELAIEKHLEITKSKEKLKINYIKNTEIETYEKNLRKSLDKDIKFGNTSVGPHRDDLSFLINDKDAKSFASQGQKRTIILSLKLALLDFIKKELDKNPVLLLDDILSELDFTRQNFILENSINVQTFITCTGIDIFNNFKNKDSNFYEVINGEFFQKDYKSIKK